MLSPAIFVAALLTLLPFVAAAFFPQRLAGWTLQLPAAVRLVCPAILCVPYALVAGSRGIFRWGWFALYALLPVAVSILIRQARQADPDQRGNWRDYLTLAVLGVAVDLRWFEPAWPPALKIFGKFLLLDTGIYAFLAIRQLDGVGFDLRLRLRDLGVGLREFFLYAPIAIPLGLALGFLHFHIHWSGPSQAAWAFGFTFLFVAIPEELFFRGWLQNLLERRLGRCCLAKLEKCFKPNEDQ